MVAPFPPFVFGRKSRCLEALLFRLEGRSCGFPAYAERRVSGRRMRVDPSRTDKSNQDDWSIFVCIRGATVPMRRRGGSRTEDVPCSTS